jgi:pyridinium-3,5-biscarboxylic acid mononucleotide synthase
MPRKRNARLPQAPTAATSAFTSHGLKALLRGVKDGVVPLEEAIERLSSPPGIDLDFAVLDAHRPLRTGLPEVVYGAGKTAAQIATLLGQLHAMGQPAIATRVDEEKAAAVRAALPQVTWHAVARVLTWLADPPAAPPAVLGPIGVVCAGTSDLAVFEEAAVVLEALGQPVRRFRDVGVAGLHRVLGRSADLRACHVLIVVAGMEGALPSVIAGLVGRPVIAVPTSVGYGASFGGIAALLGMLNACAPGVAVVNIDNGFGAAAMAALVNRA